MRRCANNRNGHCRRSYLQGMNYLAAFLLLVAGDEESAFWLLAASA